MADNTSNVTNGASKLQHLNMVDMTNPFMGVLLAFANKDGVEPGDLSPLVIEVTNQGAMVEKEKIINKKQEEKNEIDLAEYKAGIEGNRERDEKWADEIAETKKLKHRAEFEVTNSPLLEAQAIANNNIDTINFDHKMDIEDASQAWGRYWQEKQAELDLKLLQENLDVENKDDNKTLIKDMFKAAVIGGTLAAIFGTPAAAAGVLYFAFTSVKDRFFDGSKKEMKAALRRRGNSATSFQNLMLGNQTLAAAH